MPSGTQKPESTPNEKAITEAEIGLSGLVS